MRVGDKVQTIKDSKVVTGVIKDIYFPVAVVAFDEGMLEKVPLSSLALVEDEKTQENEEKTQEQEIKEKSEITITPDEFRRIASDVVAKRAVKLHDMKFGLLGACIVAELHRALFFEDNQE